MLAFAHALGDRDVQRAVLDRDVARAVDLGHAERDRALGAVVGVAQVDDDLGVMVLALRVELARAREAAASPAKSARCAPPPRMRPNRPSKKSLNCAEFGAGIVAAARILEARVPVGRRTEVLPLLPVGAELVVGRALLGVLQDLVGLARVLEFRFRARVLVDVGMIGARELAVGALDVVLAGVSLDAEDLVVVLIFHGDGGPETGRAVAWTIAPSRSRPVNPWYRQGILSLRAAAESAASDCGRRLRRAATLG